MSAAPILRVVLQREPADCAVAALAMYTGASYEDVLRAVAVTDRNQGRKGLWVNTIRRVAEQLGHPLKKRRAIDWENGNGVLELPAHAVVLRNGLIIEGDGTIWPADVYLAHQDVRPDDCELLVTTED